MGRILVGSHADEVRVDVQGRVGGDHGSSWRPTGGYDDVAGAYLVAGDYPLVVRRGCTPGAEPLGLNVLDAEDLDVYCAAPEMTSAVGRGTSEHVGDFADTDGSGHISPVGSRCIKCFVRMRILQLT